jgi:hypothetical protein
MFKNSKKSKLFTAYSADVGDFLPHTLVDVGDFLPHTQ